MRLGAIFTCVAASTISMSSSPRTPITSSIWSADDVGRQRLVDLVVGQEALRFAEVDELLHFLSVSAMRPVLHLFGALAPFGLVLSHRLTSSLFKAVLLARTAIYLAQKSVFCGGVPNSFATVQGFDHLRFAPGELSPLELLSILNKNGSGNLTMLMEW